MLNSLISRSADLTELVRTGYRLEIRGAYLLVQGIPYIREDGEIKAGDIVTSLDLVEGEAGEETSPPSDHTVWWTGEVPHRANGESMEEYLSCGSWHNGHDLGEGIRVYMRWSRKPKEGGKTRGYRDYLEKIGTYVDEVGGQAESKQPGVLEAARAGWEPSCKSNSRFHYIDTNSYRNGTKGIEEKIEDQVVAVIGTGGTGSYLVDILAKTNVKEVHLYDDDVMKVHNAFRVAGAARIGELGGRKLKVDWHNERYAAVRKEGLHIHRTQVDGANLECLRSYSTVFIAVDKLSKRRRIQQECSEMGIWHFAVGIGLEIEGDQNDQIGGMVKVESNYEVVARDAESAKGSDLPHNNLNDVYGSNIQTVELNMLGAALAIAEWKAKAGIYRNERDLGNDSTIYSVTTGRIEATRKSNR